jgi:hypothetical protein
VCGFWTPATEAAALILFMSKPSTFGMDNRDIRA